jgi:hypothetical protein
MTGGLRKFKTQSEATTNKSGNNQRDREESVRGILQADIMIEEDSFAASALDQDIEEEERQKPLLQIK